MRLIQNNRWLAGAFLVVLLVAQTAVGQTSERLRGIVIDDHTGAPVTEARVVVGDSYVDAVDRFGRFSFEHIPPGVWTLSVTAPGYDTAVVRNVTVTADAVRDLTIRLKHREYLLPGIEVRSKRDATHSDSRIVLNREDIDARQPRDLVDLLSQIEGVMVQGGGGAEAATVSIRGSAPEHVLVVVDGQRIDMAANAGIDLRSIPIDHIQQVAVVKGGASAEYGANALGGVIAISTQLVTAAGDSRVSAERSVGRWDASRYGLSGYIPVPTMGGGVRLGFSEWTSLNDFSFNYSVEPRPVVISGDRANNYREESSYFGSGIASLGSNTRLRFSAQSYRQEAGLPGPGSRQSEHGFREDERLLGSINLEAEQGLHRLTVDFGANRYQQYFEDTAVTPAERYLTEFTNDRLMLRAGDVMQIDRGMRLSIGTELTRDIVMHDDLLRRRLSMGRTVRDNAALFAHLSKETELPSQLWFDILVVDAAFRQDWVTTHKDSTSFADVTQSHSLSELSPKLGAALSTGGETSLTARASWGESYRLPTLNALFWHGDVRSRGNPGLRPERSEHIEAGLSGSADLGWVRMSVEITWHRSNITDLIVWRAGQGGVWQPANLASARLSGHEESVTAHLFDDRLRLRYQNSVIDARNRVPGSNSYNKVLTFRPGYQIRYSSELHWAWLRAEYGIRMVDRRYATEANTKYYDAYTVHDMRLGVSVEPVDHWQIDVASTVENLWQEDYVLIAQYPIPGRYWEFGIELTYTH